MLQRENEVRTMRFETPERIPVSFGINPACWHHYPPDSLQELMELHPLLFPGFKATSNPVAPKIDLRARPDRPYRDAWGCLWKTTEEGIVGTVVEHYLDDWKKFDGFEAPDPEKTDGVDPICWADIEEDLKKQEGLGRLAKGTLTHGHTFLRLCDLRGYENVIFDMMDDNPRLWDLIRMVEGFNLALVNRFIALGSEWMGYGEDLGMQTGPMISPALFRKYIKPSYRRLMAPARDAGCFIYMHSDGDIRSLAGDILEVGVEVINLQDTVNGIDWIRENLAGKVCIDLDINRQRITTSGTVEQIDAHIRTAVEKLGSKKGGLMLKYGLYPGVPLKNVRAMMDAMEQYSSYYF